MHKRAVANNGKADFLWSESNFSWATAAARLARQQSSSKLQIIIIISQRKASTGGRTSLFHFDGPLKFLLCGSIYQVGGEVGGNWK